jgi:hypothetical protein
VVQDLTGDVKRGGRKKAKPTEKRLLMQSHRSCQTNPPGLGESGQIGGTDMKRYNNIGHTPLPWCITEYGENPDGTPKFYAIKHGEKLIANCGINREDAELIIEAVWKLLK